MKREVWIICMLAITAASMYPRGKELQKSAGLAPSRQPARREAVIWYLGHCGYAVQTEHSFLIFDYQERRDGAQPKVRPDARSLDNGWIDPEEIKHLAVRIFVSHSHEDHYDPVVLSWRQVIPDIAYYFGWDAGDDSLFHEFIEPRTGLISGNLDITTINSHHSGVPEVAWLVKVDGLAIYHNGDCQPGDFAAEYDFLKTKAELIDLAFVPPVHEERWKYSAQNTDLFRKFNPRAVFPMHARAGDVMYADFKKAFETRIPGLSVSTPQRMGERFVFKHMHIQKDAKNNQ